MWYGAHVSIAGGIDQGIRRGEDLGCTAIQTFGGSPRTINFTPIAPTVVAHYQQLKTKSRIKVHILHGVYLINLASEKAEYLQACVANLICYQKLAYDLGALGTVFHVGSHKGLGFEAVADQVGAALTQVIKASPPDVDLILENTAGQNGAIGAAYSELASLRDRVERQGAAGHRLAIGLDTQHAFGAGYDLRKMAEVERLVNDIDQTWGLEALKVIHVNDSQVGCGTKKDRHANLGQGEIGLASLGQTINHPKLQSKPLILEVPGDDHSGPRREDVANLKQLLSNKDENME